MANRARNVGWNTGLGWGLARDHISPGGAGLASVCSAGNEQVPCSAPRRPAVNSWSLTGTDRAALAVYPQLERLIELRESGWFFRPVLVDRELELLTGVRMWPDGWSDAVAIRDLGDARAFRCDPAGGEVWQREGGLVDVIDALADLPAPHEPGAPRLVKAAAPDLWLPRR